MSNWFLHVGWENLEHQTWTNNKNYFLTGIKQTILNILVSSWCNQFTNGHKRHSCKVVYSVSTGRSQCHSEVCQVLYCTQFELLTHGKVSQEAAVWYHMSYETFIPHVSIAPIRKGNITPVNIKRLTKRKLLLTVVTPVFNLLFILEKFPLTQVSLELFQFCPHLRLTSASVHLFKCPPTLTWPLLFRLFLNKIIDVEMPEVNTSKHFCIFYKVPQS